MFVGRTQELERLNGLYAAPHSGMIVLYGRSGIGKTALARQFVQDKNAVYYAARRVTHKEQLLCMNREWNTGDADNYYEALSMLYASRKETGKLVFVLDEFRNLLEDSAEFLTGFLRFYSEHHADGSVLVLLISSSIHWVENEMTGVLGSAVRLLQGFIKLKEFSFMELAGYHKGSSVQANIYTAAVLGSVPAYLRYWNEKDSFKNNVMKLFLSEDAPLFSEAEHYLKKELRELSAYNVILAALAQGKYKLNDISVYLKNLTELDSTEKLFSFDTSEQKNVQKGLYRIREPFLRFWYRFVYPNLSEIAAGAGEAVYDKKIAPVVNEYVTDTLRSICGEYLQVMNKYGKLGARYENFGVWYGKKGTVDVIAKTGNGTFLVGFCDCRSEFTGKDELMHQKEVLEAAGIRPEEWYCFSVTDFTTEAVAFAGENGIRLVCAKDM